MNLGPVEVVLIMLAILLLLSYKKLPDARRSLGRSLRIFKGEMNGMEDDDVGGRDGAQATILRGELAGPASAPVSPAGGYLTAQLADDPR